MNLKARIKQRATHKEAVANQVAVAVLNNMGAFPDQSTQTMSCVSSRPSVSQVLDDKHAEALKWIDDVTRSCFSPLKIAEALNAVVLPKKKSWFSRIFGV